METLTVEWPERLNLAFLPTPLQRLRRMSLCDATVARYHLPVSVDRREDIEIIDGYVGCGYALSRPEELALICDLARTEGLYVDPVYTGKAFYGMVGELEKQPGCFGDTVLFLHTGGLFGLFPKAGEIEPLLEA
jgi:D-cysteine desulfhydrase